MPRASIALISLILAIADLPAPVTLAQQVQKVRDARSGLPPGIPPVSSSSTVKRDYDIVYVRAPRKGDAVGTNWAEISNPLFMDPGADLMLLHPDGEEDLLVAGG